MGASDRRRQACGDRGGWRRRARRVDRGGVPAPQEREAALRGLRTTLGSLRPRRRPPSLAGPRRGNDEGVHRGRRAPGPLPGSRG